MIWSSTYPEVPMNILYNLKYPNPYIYLQKGDWATINNSYQQGYVSQYLIPRLPLVLNESDAQVWKVINGVPPTSNSQTVLVVPSNDEINRNVFLPYDMLSLGRYNYTVMLDSDPNFFKAETAIIGDDKSANITNNILDYLKTNDGKRFVILNTDGYGSFFEYFFKGKVQINVSVNSTAKNLYLYPTGNYVAASTMLNETPLGNSIEFTIDNALEENNATIIADDMQTQFWHVQLNSISSNIILSDDSSEKVKGTDSLKQMWNMSTKDWGKIYHEWTSNQDWSKNDFLCFYYKGNNSGKRVEVGIYAPDALNMQRWIFIDNFTDWRRFVFALNKSSEGWQIGSPDLSRVRQLEFFVPSSGGYPISYTWHLDRVLLDTGRWVDCEMTLSDKNAFKGLMCFNGSNYVEIPYAINASEEIPGDRLYYLDGQNAGELFTDKLIARILTMEGNNNIQMLLSFKMPPDDGEGSEKFGLSQSRFKIELATEGFNATQISGEKGQIKLPLGLEVMPVSTKDDVTVLSSYTNGQTNSPFAVKKIIGNSEIIYINIYPLNEAMLPNEVAIRSFYPMLGNLLEIANVDLPKYDNNVVPWIMNDAVPFLIFKNTTLAGNVNVYSTSVIFPQEVNFKKIIIKTGIRELSLENVTSLVIQNGDNVNIFAHQIEISSGKGFYPLLTADSPQITIMGSNADLAIKLANGSIVNVNNEPMPKLSIDGSISVYVRTPSIQNDGESKFNEAYAIHSYYANLQTLGETLCIRGYVKFDMPLSDTYSFATDFIYSGSVERQPPLLQWDEWGSIKESAFWLVVSSSFFVTLFLINRYLNVEVKVHIKRKLKAVS
jgi:hypothetical protein